MNISLQEGENRKPKKHTRIALVNGYIMDFLSANGYIMERREEGSPQFKNPPSRWSYVTDDATVGMQDSAGKTPKTL